MAKQAFPLLTFESLVTQIKASTGVESLFRQACETLEKIPAKAQLPPSFRPETFHASSIEGIRCEQPYELLQEAEFEKRHGLTFAEVKNVVPIEVVKNERGEEMRGILVANGPRTFTVFGEHLTDHREYIHDSAGQLRAKEGLELSRWYRDDLCKIQPRGAVQKNKSSKVTTAADIEDAVSKVLAEKERQKLAQAEVAPSEAADAASAAEPVKEASESADEIEYDFHDDSPLKGPSACGKLKRKEGKTAAKGVKRPRQRWSRRQARRMWRAWR